MFEVNNLCVLCQNCLDEPVHLNCGHRMCRVCLAQWESTYLKVCPQCEQKLRKVEDKQSILAKDIENPATIRPSTALLLPALPLPAPHSDLLLLYHGGDESIERPDKCASFCCLGCYIESSNLARRFVYCENCDTAFHRIEFGEGSIRVRQSSLGGIIVPLNQFAKSLTSRASLIADIQHKNQGILEIHAQMLGHAVYCDDDRCGYSACRLMKSFIRPSAKRPKKRARIEPHPIGTDSSSIEFSAITAPIAASASAAASNSEYSTSPIYPTQLDVRQAEIDRAVGLGQACRHCVRAARLLQKHTQLCTTGANCPVPYCSNLKQQQRRHK